MCERVTRDTLARQQFVEIYREHPVIPGILNLPEAGCSAFDGDNQRNHGNRPAAACGAVILLVMAGRVAATCQASALLRFR